MFLEKGDANRTFVTYRTERFNIASYETRVADIKDNVIYRMDEVCAIIPLWKQVCTDGETTCQLAEIEIELQKTQSLH